MSTILMVYLCIALAGFVMLFFSFLGGLDHDVEIGHDVDHPGELNSETMSPSFFSIKVISCFLLGAGLGATISRSWITGPLSNPPSIFLSGYLVDGLFAIVGGFVMGWLGWRIIKLFFSQQGSSNYDIAGFVGKQCVVSLSIPVGGIGEINATIGGVLRSLDVKSADGFGIKAGTLVKVLSISGSIGIVTAENVKP